MNSEPRGGVTAVFTGGGTGGHIYPGLAVAAMLRESCVERGIPIKICWIGNCGGMDRTIVEKSIGAHGGRTADVFYGIPSGKLRRYASIRTVFDVFKVAAGCVCAFFLLLKLRPAVLFSKGGFVSVPPCLCAWLLGIPVYTHECDFTPGLATRINSRFAKKILLSYEETKDYLRAGALSKAVVTGNPVRPAFDSADARNGRTFLRIPAKTKPLLLVLGGSSGARQINALVSENIDWLCERFVVVHQTGAAGAPAAAPFESCSENYRAYPFIHAEMPDVIAAADIVLSRAGANSIWECAVLGKPLVLVPLCGGGTRGDQEENAAYFEKAGAAMVLAREKADSARLRDALSVLLDESVRASYGAAARALAGSERPAARISALLFSEIAGLPDGREQPPAAEEAV